MLRVIGQTFAIQNNRADQSDDNEIEHMHAVEVEVEDFIFEILQEVLFGFVRVPDFLYGIAHFLEKMQGLLRKQIGARTYRVEVAMNI